MTDEYATEISVSNVGVDRGGSSQAVGPGWAGAALSLTHPSF